MKKVFYIYMHLKSSTNEVFYVGKGRDGRAYSKHGRNKHWHNIVNKYGYKTIIVENNLSHDEASTLEKFWITEIGRVDLNTGSLVNMTGGGEGNFNPSEKTRQAMSEKAKELHRNPEFQDKWINGLRSAIVGNKDFSKKVSANNKKFKTGVPKSLDHKEKIKQSMIKTLADPEIKKKMVEANRRINSTPSVIEKNRYAQLMRHKAAIFFGKKPNEITREMRLSFQTQFNL